MRLWMGSYYGSAGLCGPTFSCVRNRHLANFALAKPARNTVFLSFDALSLRIRFLGKSTRLSNWHRGAFGVDNATLSDKRILVEHIHEDVCDIVVIGLGPDLRVTDLL